MSFELNDLDKRFGDFQALQGVSLSVKPGEFIALLGPSGSGKTTLLRILAGLEFPDRGTVEHEGHDWLALPARKRGVGLVFQHYALFRHLTVFENVAFGLRIKPWRSRPSRAEIATTVAQLLKRVQLDGMGERYPGQLSGGQRQRVALARALAVNPTLLLLDEPFGALDAQVRANLRRWLRHLHEELGLTTVFVTHDQEEALELADRVVVMNKGRIEQIGTPEEIYQQPATPFAFEFIGRSNRLEGKVAKGVLALGGTPFDTESLEGVDDGPAQVYVRPEHLALAPAQVEGGWHGRIAHVFLAGSIANLELEITGLAQPLLAEMGGEEVLRRGLRAGSVVTIQPRVLTAFPIDRTDGRPSAKLRRVLHPRYSQASVARLR